MGARSTLRTGRLGVLAAAAAALVLLAAPVAGASESAFFTAKVDNTLTTDILSTKAAVQLEVGVPEVFHSFGSQAARYPAGFTTVPGPFSGPGAFDAIVIAATAHSFSPQFARFSFQIKNGTTGQVITESPAGVTVSLNDIPLDIASSASLSDHCNGDPFFDPFYKAVVFQITLAPPVNAVTVGPTDDLQLILTPTSMSAGPLELCVEHSTFFTAMSLVVDRIPSPPVAHDDTATTPKNTPVTIDVLANDDDADGDTLSVTNLSGAAHGTPALNPDGTITYTPNTGFGGTDTFTYTANDGTADSNVATVTVQVVNTPPVSVNDSATTFKNIPVTINVLANDSDADGDGLAVTNLTAAGNGTVQLNADGTITYTPNTGFSGFDGFTYTANDGTDDGNVASVTVQVINRPPVSVNDSASTFKNIPVTINVLANDTDADGDALAVTNLTAGAHGTTHLNPSGTVTYTPNPGFSGFDGFTYTANDGTDDGNVAFVSVEVINRPPDCSAVRPSIATLWSPNHRFVAVNVLGVTDPDGDPTSITINSIRQDEPTGANAPDGKGVGTSRAEVRAERIGGGDGRVYHIRFTADDGDGGTCSSTVRVSVPHDQGKGSTAVDGGALFDSTS